MNWQGRYLLDEWGHKIIEEVTVPSQLNDNGEVITPEFTDRRPMHNPDWKPDEHEYISRVDRPEWVAVGLVGQLRVRDDGTCQPDGYCLPNKEGIATASEYGYKILQRTGANQVLIIMNGHENAERWQTKLSQQQAQVNEQQAQVNEQQAQLNEQYRAQIEQQSQLTTQQATQIQSLTNQIQQQQEVIQQLLSKKY
jgi:hypothetical protein